MKNKYDIPLEAHIDDDEEEEIIERPKRKNLFGRKKEKDENTIEESFDKEQEEEYEEENDIEEIDEEYNEDENPPKKTFLRRGLFFIFLGAIVVIGIIAFVTISNSGKRESTNQTEGFTLPTSTSSLIPSETATTSSDSLLNTTSSNTTLSTTTATTAITTESKTLGSYKEEGGKKYYYDADGEKVIGVKTVDGKLIGTNEDGSIEEGKHKDSKGYFYTDENGIIDVGWNNKTYTGATGYLVTGMQEIEGKSYFFNEDGEVQTGWVEYDKKKYYADETGAFVTGWKEVEGQNYYFDPALKTGWQELEGHYYYFDTDGNAVKNKKVKINGQEYTFDGNGWADKAPEKS